MGHLWQKGPLLGDTRFNSCAPHIWGWYPVAHSTFHPIPVSSIVQCTKILDGDECPKSDGVMPVGVEDVQISPKRHRADPTQKLSEQERGCW